MLVSWTLDLPLAKVSLLMWQTGVMMMKRKRWNNLAGMNTFGNSEKEECVRSDLQGFPSVPGRSPGHPS